jgi:two-component system NarL family response regulator
MKVMLVDDHFLFLEGLQYLLETYGIEVVGKARDGNEAVIKAHNLRPDIILMDIRMPNCSGLEAVKRISEELPEIKLVMLTTSEEDEDLFNAIKFGASGYLLKDTDAKKLVEYLENVENGEMPLSPGLAAKLMVEFRRSKVKNGSLTQNKPNTEKPELTERQLEVLELIAHGATYKEAGESLGLSERTVKYHISRMFDTLHLENKAQVILYAAQNGLLHNK